MRGLETFTHEDNYGNQYLWCRERGRTGVGYDDQIIHGLELVEERLVKVGLLQPRTVSVASVPAPATDPREELLRHNMAEIGRFKDVSSWEHALASLSWLSLDLTLSDVLTSRRLESLHFRGDEDFPFKYCFTPGPLRAAAAGRPDVAEEPAGPPLLPSDRSDIPCDLAVYVRSQGDYFYTLARNEQNNMTLRKVPGVQVTPPGRPRYYEFGRPEWRNVECGNIDEYRVHSSLVCQRGSDKVAVLLYGSKRGARGGEMMTTLLRVSRASEDYLEAFRRLPHHMPGQRGVRFQNPSPAERQRAANERAAAAWS